MKDYQIVSRDSRLGGDERAEGQARGHTRRRLWRDLCHGVTARTFFHAVLLGIVTLSTRDTLDALVEMVLGWCALRRVSASYSIAPSAAFR